MFIHMRRIRREYTRQTNQQSILSCRIVPFHRKFKFRSFELIGYENTDDIWYNLPANLHVTDSCFVLPRVWGKNPPRSGVFSNFVRQLQFLGCNKCQSSSLKAVRNKQSSDKCGFEDLFLAAMKLVGRANEGLALALALVPNHPNPSRMSWSRHLNSGWRPQGADHHLIHGIPAKKRLFDLPGKGYSWDYSWDRLYNMQLWSIMWL